MARELDGTVILCLCWAHMRHDYINCAADDAQLTGWCQERIKCIASIYQLNKTRLIHYDPEAAHQNQAFTMAQQVLKSAVEGLFTEAEQELATLPELAPQVKPLRSLPAILILTFSCICSVVL